MFPGDVANGLFLLQVLIVFFVFFLHEAGLK